MRISRLALIGAVLSGLATSPVFLDVVSVINQYAVETQVDLRWTWVNPVASIGDSHSAGGAARGITAPTLTRTGTGTLNVIPVAGSLGTNETVTFATADLAPGTYEVRFFPNDTTSIRLASSPAFVVW